MKRKKVLVYPCGTEIGLEIYKAICFSNRYELIGGASNYDHGQFVFQNIINGLPFIKDDSGEEEIIAFEKAIQDYDIDFIYPAMDGVVAVFARYRQLFKETIIAPDSETAELCRSKKITYEKLGKDKEIGVPYVYKSMDEVERYPVFVKPDKGQGSVGAHMIENRDKLEEVDFEKQVVMELLPGKEYTVDCFTNGEGRLIFARGRSRKRIKNGISVNAVFEDDPLFFDIAERINALLKQKGGWFFQLKEDGNGRYKLLEVAARIAGTSAISRNIGANLPLMSVEVFDGVQINDVAINDCEIELDRALHNVYKTDISFRKVYIDYDGTVVQNGQVNTCVIRFLYQCVNEGISLSLMENCEDDIDKELNKYRLSGLFDEIIHLDGARQKSDCIKEKDSIFIDDSYEERKSVKSALGIPVFDTHMIECLLKE